ncbi:putative carbonic anhydrase-like protein 1 [Mizuhopecten yessoensis]|uniref:putative carbonic anhydrase-like protein 1 n=1 Tax=Mizuhopecten yessoensis TaxID=6573 RepID=UPI000B45C15E|nr:putative carbonic anhydrase-like protein 1 [Mizuhopecten yessoensis]
MKFDVSPFFTGVVKMSIARGVYFLAVICALVYCEIVEDRWKQWWGYDLMAGPEMWGRTGPYKMCSNGKQQSPIDIHPDMLLFDPNLKHVKVETVPVNGKLTNTGNDITLVLDPDFINHVNVSQGPLSYVYHVTALKFHYSKVDINGSEHRIAGRSFPAELQMIGYNGDLYENMSRAENSSNGIVVISTFLEIAPEKTDENPALDILTAKLDEISWERGAFVQITSFSIDELLPLTDHYITYEGSMTQPSCQETVTWIIFNKPSYISEKQLNAFRGVWMEWQMKNIRPAMPLNHRVLRTNINTRKQSGLCSMKRDLFYDVNSNFRT